MLVNHVKVYSLIKNAIFSFFFEKGIYLSKKYAIIILLNNFWRKFL